MAGAKPLPQGINLTEIAEMYEGIDAAVEAELAMLHVSSSLPVPGLPSALENKVPTAVNGDPTSPTNLESFPSEDLGLLFAYFSAWANYVACELTQVKVYTLEAEKVLRAVKSALRLAYRQQGEPVGLLDDYVYTDPRFATPDGALDKAKALTKVLTTRHDNMRRTLHLISREQTRRGESYEDNNNTTEGGGWSRPKTFGTKGRRRG